MWALRVDQAVTRRTVLKGLAGVGLGAVAGAASHGFLYERHHLELTRASFPIAGLPEALRGLRVGLPLGHPSQPDRLARSGRGGRPDGDGRAAGSDRAGRRLRHLEGCALHRPCRRRAGAAECAARRHRGAGQSRRRPRHARGARGEGIYGAARRANARHACAAKRSTSSAFATGRIACRTSRVCCAAACPTRSCWRTHPNGSTRRSSSRCRPSSAATRTAGRSCCPGSARWRHGSSQSWPATRNARERRSSSAAAWAPCTCRSASTVRQRSPSSRWNPHARLTVPPDQTCGDR